MIPKRSEGCCAGRSIPQIQAPFQDDPEQGRPTRPYRPLPPTQHGRDTGRQKFMQPAQHDSVLDPTPAADTRQRHRAGTIPRKAGRESVRTSTRASGHSSSNLATATCNMATSPMFLYSASPSLRLVATITRIYPLLSSRTVSAANTGTMVRHGLTLWCTGNDTRWRVIQSLRQLHRCERGWRTGIVARAARLQGTCGKRFAVPLNGPAESLLE